jgi:hypothetical protein
MSDVGVTVNEAKGLIAHPQIYSKSATFIHCPRKYTSTMIGKGGLDCYCAKNFGATESAGASSISISKLSLLADVLSCRVIRDTRLTQRLEEDGAP